MGVYDIVCDIQVKCTPDQTLKRYKIGDFIQLEDGIYIGYEGWFSVSNSKVTGAGVDIYDKWGAKMIISDLLRPGSVLRRTEED